MMKQISILGCGWLGLPLAQSLIEKGYVIKGSTTTLEKIQRLKNAAIIPYQLALLESGIEGEITTFLENSEILIIDIPPKLRGTSSENFVAKIERLLPFLEKSTIKKVLFVSSTSVYADNNAIVTEATLPQPETESGKQLLQAEQLLQSNEKIQTTIVRFGGLIGENRHPIRFLSGKKSIENPEAPINFIQQIDCIGILIQIIQKEIWKEIFNAVAPQHPSRQEYYTQKAAEFSLVAPEFNHSIPSVGKTISSEKVQSLLGYTFQMSV